MTRQEFDKLIEKYNSGECTPDEIEAVEKWSYLHFRRQSESTVFDGEDEMRQTRERIWENVTGEAGLRKPRKFAPGKGSMFRAGLAASVLLALTTGMLLKDRLFVRGTDAEPAGIETKNTTVSRQKIVLPDSSTVVLEAGAMIVADERYGKETRIVHLKGEGYFEVKPNAQIPFLVYTGELVTEVLGTSFRIRPQERKGTIEVSVMTGKVSVYTGNPGRDKKRNGVIATSNQKIVFDTESRTIRQDLVDIPEMIVPPQLESSFQFDDTPVEEVLGLMKKVYGIEIVIGNAALKRCVFTGDLNGLGLYEQLDHMCDVLRISYEIRGTGIYISGSGCG